MNVFAGSWNRSYRAWRIASSAPQVTSRTSIPFSPASKILPRQPIATDYGRHSHLSITPSDDLPMRTRSTVMLKLKAHRIQAMASLLLLIGLPSPSVTAQPLPETQRCLTQEQLDTPPVFSQCPPLGGEASVSDNSLISKIYIDPYRGVDEYKLQWWSPTDLWYERTYTYNPSTGWYEGFCGSQFFEVWTGWCQQEFWNFIKGTLTADDVGTWSYTEYHDGEIYVSQIFEMRELQLKAVSGENQIGLVNDYLPKPLTLKLESFEEIGIADEVINWAMDGPSGAKNAAVYGIGTGSNSKTNSQGVEVASVHLGSKTGTYTVTLSNRRITPESYKTFTFTAVDDIEDLDPDEEHEETEEDAGEDEDSCDNVGNPISLASGNKFQREVDFEATGISPTEFVRYHNSLGFISRSFTNYWTHTYDRYVEIPIDPLTQPVKVVRPDGKKINFTWNGTGFQPFPGVHATLEQVASGWTFIDDEMTVENFNVAGLLLDIKDVQGRIQTATHDSNGKLIRIESNLGGSLNFVYDGAGRLSTVTDQANRTWTYRYETLGRLAFVDRPDGTTREYHYEDLRVPYALTGITLENGQRYSWYEYDDQGLAIASYHANNADRVDIQYETNGDRVVLDPQGNATVYQTHFENKRGFLDGISGPICSQGCGQTDTQYSYDTNKNVISKTAYGITTQYGDYDAKGQPGFMIEAVGLPEEKRTDFEYDPGFYNKITRITEPSVYAGAHKVTTRSYDFNGNMLSETVSGFNPFGQSVSRTITNTFNGPLGQLSTADGPRTDVSDVTTFEYYPNTLSEGFNRGRLKAIIDPTGIRTRDNIAYSPTGKVLSETRPNGITVSYEYFAGNDRIKSVTESGGGLFNRTQLEYYPSGEVEWLIFDDETGQEIVSRFQYDNARRLTRIDSRVTRGGPPYYQYDADQWETYQIDDAGNVTRITRGSTGSATLVMDRVFDAYNRVNTVTQGGVTEDYDYNPDGTLGAVTDGNLNTTTYTYDAFKRLTNVQQIGQIDTTMSYDGQGNNLTVTDPLGNTTQFLYDDLGNRVQKVSPDTGVTTYDFSESGQVITETDAKSQVTVYTYDAAGRLTSIDRTGTDYDITYVFDSCANGTGRLCEISTGWGHTIQYQWNSIGELQGTTSNEGQVGYTFGPQNTLTSITYPSGRVVYFDIDGGGLPTQIRLGFDGVPDSILVQNIKYSPLGRPVSWLYGNGQQTSVSVDGRHRPTAINVPGVWNWQATQYDNNGNILSLTNANDTFTYGYDGLNRLTSADSTPDAISFDYDDLGNRLSKTTNGIVVAGTYEPGSNRISTYGDRQYTLDSNGNTAAISVNQILETSYSYSSHDRLVEVFDEGSSSALATYRYDGQGQRVEKITDTGTRRFIYGINGELLVELDGSGAILHEFVYLNGQPVVDLGEVPEGPPPTMPQDVIIDNSEAYVFGANWQTQSHSLAENGSYVKNRKMTDRGVYWYIDQTGASGAYDVFVKWFNPAGDGTSTRYQVNVRNDAGNGSVSTSVTVNHADHSVGDWVYFGNFDIKPLHPSRQYVQLTGFDNYYNNPGTFLEVDAVRLVPTFAPSGYFSIRYIHGDHLGTPQFVTDEAGQVIWSVNYQPFGEATVDEDPDGDLEFYVLNLRFPGQYFDAESGLHYNYFRDYDPLAGRYIESDPIGLFGGLNTFSYAANNPLNATDPLGLTTFSLGVGAQFQIVDMGASGSATIGVDSTGRVCTQVTVCARVGPGNSVGGTGIVEVGQGTFCEGNSLTGGAFVEGGSGPFVGGSVNIGEAGGSGNIGVVKPGVGAGAAAGAQVCTTKTHCFW